MNISVESIFNFYKLLLSKLHTEKQSRDKNLTYINGTSTSFFRATCLFDIFESDEEGKKRKPKISERKEALKTRLTSITFIVSDWSIFEYACAVI